MKNRVSFPLINSHSELLVWVGESRGHVHVCCVDRVESRVACLESSRIQYIFGGLWLNCNAVKCPKNAITQAYTCVTDCSRLVRLWY